MNAFAAAVAEISTAVYVVPTDAPEADGTLDPRRWCCPATLAARDAAFGCPTGEAEQYRGT